MVRLRRDQATGHAFDALGVVLGRLNAKHAHGHTQQAFRLCSNVRMATLRASRRFEVCSRSYGFSELSGARGPTRQACVLYIGDNPRLSVPYRATAVHDSTCNAYMDAVPLA